MQPFEREIFCNLFVKKRKALPVFRKRRLRFFPERLLPAPARKKKPPLAKTKKTWYHLSCTKQAKSCTQKTKKGSIMYLYEYK